MTTPHVLERLPLWVGGDLDPAGLAAVEAHLADCPTCREAAERLTASQSSLREALVSPFDVTDRRRLHDHVMARLRAEALPASRSRLTFRRGLLAAAATLLVAALSWRLGGQTGTPRVPLPRAAAAPAPTSRPPGPMPPAPPSPVRPSAQAIPRHEPGSSSPGQTTRIEFQTLDPTVRIIWLAQATPLPDSNPFLEEEP